MKARGAMDVKENKSKREVEQISNLFHKFGKNSYFQMWH